VAHARQELGLCAGRGLRHLLGADELQLGQLLHGGVLHLRREADEPLLFVAHRGHGQETPHDVTVLVDVPLLVLVHPDGALAHPFLEDGQVFLEVLRVRDDPVAVLEQRRLRVADEVAERLVELDPLAAGVGEDHADAGSFECNTKMTIAETLDHGRSRVDVTTTGAARSSLAAREKREYS
jgi:hypothetical protein